MEDKNNEEEQGVDYFARPDPSLRQAFLNYHPKQEAKSPVVRKVFTRDGSCRKWLTYSEGRHSLFCFVCLSQRLPSFV